LDDGRNRFISVVWKKGKDIVAAFQVRRKRHDIDIITSLKDRKKLHSLQAEEKYIVNVSEKTGKASFHRVTEQDDKDIIEIEQKISSKKEESKAYSLDVIRLKHARAYEPWTQAEDGELISDYRNNLSVSAMAEKHKRQRSAIRSRLRKFSKRGLI
jgi:myo-inositol-1-phosphate synthase